MNDLFAFGRMASTTESEASYGLGGDMKKTQYVLQLLGNPANADTLKCLITAVEMGMETDSAVLDILHGQDESSDYLEVSPFGMVPTLKEAEYYVAGECGIMSYIEARGLGKRLAPNNASLLAQQNYWSDIACSEVKPHVNTVVQEGILAQIDNADYKVNEEAVSKARNALSAPLEALNDQLAQSPFIIGNYSFADIHWTAYVHLLTEAGEHDLLAKYPNIKAWFDRISIHKSYSGQNIIAYELLPKLADIQQQQLKSVFIDDY